MSLVDSLAQAASQDVPAYTRAVISPRWIDSVAMGSCADHRRVHQWVSSHGCSQSSWSDRVEDEHQYIHQTIAMVAPMGCSVRVETNNPIAPSAEN